PAPLTAPTPAPPASAPSPYPATAPASAPAPSSAPAPATGGSDEGCYWQDPATKEWLVRPFNVHTCYQMDACSGGLGEGGGYCYKWSLGSYSPGRTWSELGCPACP
ncbi:MAG TPA: hypothetical protein VK509_18830, partial [Polyangiales bacterium]|nr:hypothetical protein [Polyangiales bacterium]